MLASETAVHPIVIVGTGLAGYSLARELRKLDSATPILMITADDGHNYSKPMLSTGLTKGKQADELAQGDAGSMAEQLNIELRTFTTVTGIDTARHCLHIGDEELPYAKLVLAWGADVIRLNLAGNGLEHVFSINDLLDYRRFRQALEGRRHVAIMGAGLIGCEFANDLRNGGYAVTVIAPSTTALPTLAPAPIGDAVVDGLSAAGVTFELGRAVTRVDRAEQRAHLTLDDGRVVDADIVISAVGLRPRTALAKAAGLAVGNGIQVNRALETSAEDVYALGDCAEVDGHSLLYVLPLMACSRALAKTLTGTRTAVSYGVMPVMVKTPSCPVVVAPPPAGAEGAWQFDGVSPHLSGRFVDAAGRLLGFALSGDRVQEKQQLSREIPPIHAD